MRLGQYAWRMVLALIVASGVNGQASAQSAPEKKLEQEWPNLIVALNS
jgi:hypothetical protein